MPLAGGGASKMGRLDDALFELDASLDDSYRPGEKNTSFQLSNKTGVNVKINFSIIQKTLTYFVTRSITVRLTSCLTGLNSAALLMFNQQQIYLFAQIQARQTGDQLLQ